MIRDLGDIVAAIGIVLAALIVAAMFVALLVWGWQDAQDKRDCRRAGGTVVHADNEWHCVGATPEAKP